MTKLLVSVRDAEEAMEALAGGADLIDVKEPQFGSLGAASPATRTAVRHAIAMALSSLAERHAPDVREIALSAALGELREEWETGGDWQLDGYSYAKIGLARCAGDDGWKGVWRGWIARLPAATSPVAVIYADYRSAGAPSPWELLKAALETRARTILIDTCCKNSGGLLDRMSGCELTEVVSSARADGFRVALAGSITLDRLADVLRYEPDWIAVRGAVCRGGRESRLDRALVKRFAVQLSTPEGANAARRNQKLIDSTFHRA